ncbi:hypothetical protein MAHJHV28_45780 [Mycobacterium avium subsp. hominissuis]
MQALHTDTVRQHLGLGDTPPRQWDGVWRRGESVPRRGVAESEMLTDGVGVQGLHPEPG